MAPVAGTLAQPGSANCTVNWFDQQLDHFSFAPPPPGVNSTWRQRYLTYDGFWDRSANGTIFFYVGNEGPVTLYADNTGLMWENAAQFGARLVFAEHRYYGESQPSRTGDLRWLSHEQALADYAALIYALQGEAGVQQPVIAFGGSYGGMLAAWGRAKYPGTFAGAIASSAPIQAFQGAAPSSPPGSSSYWSSEAYWGIVTEDATPNAGAAPNCSANVRAAWDAMDAVAAKGSAGLQWLSTTFQLCKPLKSVGDVAALKVFQLNAWDTAAMGDFPYASNYLTGGGSAPPMPAWPVRAMCDYLAFAPNASDPYGLLEAFNAAGAVFNNATQDVACYELPFDDIFEDGTTWDYQWCTETLPEETYFARDGAADMFYPFPFNASAVDAHCAAKYDVQPNWLWIAESYGGTRLGATNIFFSNGGLDPWRAGGVVAGSPSGVGPGVSTAILPTGAHHVDLFFSQPEDPPSFAQVRGEQMAAVASWIQEWRANQA